MYAVVPSRLVDETAGIRLFRIDTTSWPNVTMLSEDSLFELHRLGALTAATWSHIKSLLQSRHVKASNRVSETLTYVLSVFKDSFYLRQKIVDYS